MLKNTRKICSIVAGLSLVSLWGTSDLPLPIPTAEAVYNSESDTDADILDYVENRRRAERENRLNEDQKKLLKDAYEMKEHLREPLDPTKNVPVAVEGDELFYDENTGDFQVKGNVVMTSLDKRRFITEEANGNLQKQDVDVPDKAYMLQLTDAQARIILNGYKTQYNWGKEEGKMENAQGKIDHQFVKAKRIEMYPDKIVLFDASATKCSAKNPDYKMTAKKIEYYPGIQTISYGVSYWLGSIPVYSVPKQVSKEGEKGIYMPKASYDSDNGFGIKDTLYYPITDNVRAYGDFFISQRSKVKTHGGFLYNTKGFGDFALRTGFFEDSDGKWIHKAPTLRWDYGAKIGKTPFNYSLAYEHGANRADRPGHHRHPSHGRAVRGPIKLRNPFHPPGAGARRRGEGLCRNSGGLHPRAGPFAADSARLRPLPQRGSGDRGKRLRPGSGSGQHPGFRILCPRGGLQREMGSGDGLYAPGKRPERGEIPPAADPEPAH